MSGNVYMGINGAARKIAKGYVGIGGAARRIKKAYIGIGGVARLCWQSSATLGSKAVGEYVYLNVNGEAREFIIVQQGNPDETMYDASCNGTWLLMTDIYTIMPWSDSSTPYNDYNNSGLQARIILEFFEALDSTAKSYAVDAILPYQLGTGADGSIAAGADGMNAQAFLLSAYEVGLEADDALSFPADGVALSYFAEGGFLRRIAKFEGNEYAWWCRTPILATADRAVCIDPEGFATDEVCSVEVGVRPALILDPSAPIDARGHITG